MQVWCGYGLLDGSSASRLLQVTQYLTASVFHQLSQLPMGAECAENDDADETT